MSALLLLAASLASAAAPVKAVVGEETVLVMDALPQGTSDFVVVKAQAQDGKQAVTLLPLTPGKIDFHGVAFDVAEPTLPDDAEISDIKGLAKARPALWPWLLLAALAAAAWYARREWLRRRKPEGPAAPAEPVLPLEFRVERDLAALEASGLWEKGEHAAYYLRLTEILRAYLEERWGVPATAMTSGEVTRLMRDRASLDLAATTRELLERSDLVKFARQKASPTDGPRDLAKVRDLVFKTAVRDEAAAAGRPA